MRLEVNTMKKTTMIKASLLGSSSALGLNWVYDRKFLRVIMLKLYGGLYEVLCCT